MLYIKENTGTLFGYFILFVLVSFLLICNFCGGFLIGTFSIYKAFVQRKAADTQIINTQVSIINKINEA